MFTRNWYYIIGGTMANLSGNTISKPIAVNGSTTYVANSGCSSINLLGSTSDYCPTLKNVATSLDIRTCGVIFGTGNTPPTADDYTLSGDIISGITATTNASYAWEDDGVVYTGSYTITNNNGSAITIREVALITCTYHSGYPVLVERTVLETPVTIEPGGVGKVTYTIRLNYPTA